MSPAAADVSRLGSLRRPALPAAALDAELARLERLDRVDLERRWRDLTGLRPPGGLPRSILKRFCALKLQEASLGGLDEATAAALRRAARGEDAPERAIKPGSMLVREHAGTLHEVMVLGDGYAWNGGTYASLTAVARAITGKPWNGPRFFGLRPRGPGKAAPAARSTRDGAPIDAGLSSGLAP
jgi:hypothetical protein